MKDNVSYMSTFNLDKSKQYCSVPSSSTAANQKYSNEEIEQNIREMLAAKP